MRVKKKVGIVIVSQLCLKGKCPGFGNVLKAHTTHENGISVARELLDAGKTAEAAQKVREAFAALNSLDALPDRVCSPMSVGQTVTVQKGV